MKKKLTLLIALSISTIGFMCSMVFLPSKPKADNSITTSSTVAIVETEEPEDDPVESSNIAIEEEIIKPAPEFPIAQEVWDTMKSFGWSDIVCAGIMGNMMRECAGNNFDLHWQAINKSSGCYGLCQWTPMYHHRVQGANIQEQLAYLKSSLENKEYSPRGGRINYGDLLERLKSLETPEAVAREFFVNYEWIVNNHPSQASVRQRQANARRAYEYFKATIE